MKTQQQSKLITFSALIIFAILSNLGNVNAQILVTVDTTICDNDQIFLEGAWQNTSGVYFDTTWCSIPACNVYTTTNLTVSSVINDTIDVVICEGETHQLTNGNTVSTAGVYLDNSISGVGLSLIHI